MGSQHPKRPRTTSSNRTGPKKAHHRVHPLQTSSLVKIGKRMLHHWQEVPSLVVILIPQLEGGENTKVVPLLEIAHRRGPSPGPSPNANQKEGSALGRSRVKKKRCEKRQK